jgi:hypothetical protein
LRSWDVVLGRLQCSSGVLEEVGVYFDRADGSMVRLGLVIHRIATFIRIVQAKLNQRNLS